VFFTASSLHVMAMASTAVEFNDEKHTEQCEFLAQVGEKNVVVVCIKLWGLEGTGQRK